jgi:8-oxo-dGTP pyrophosphatase MutT (NUDIX family)
MGGVTVVRAAGGLLWREGPSGPRLALVHRPRRDDWSLPKGKLDEGESFEEAALREVEEETGCKARITAFAGATSYLARRAPKVVLYWHMALVREGRLDAGDEIDEVAWLGPAEAVARLDYEVDRRLVSRSPPGGGSHPAAPGAQAAAVAAERADLQRRLLALDPGADAAGLGPALELLDRADEAAARGDGAEVRVLVAGARRLALLSAGEPERSLRARALRERARTLAPWRRAAVRKLLASDRKVSPEALHVAAALCDEDDERGAGGRVRIAIAAGAGLLAASGLAAGVALAEPPVAAAALAGAASGLVGGAAVVLAAAWRRGSGR